MQRDRRIDAALLAVAGAFAAGNALHARLVPHRTWGAWTWWVFLAAAALALLTRSFRARVVLTGAVVVLTAVVPTVRLAVERLDRPEGTAQSEVIVIEAMADRLVDDGNPYLDPAAIEVEAAKPRVGFRAYGPYHPAMAAFGLPRAIGGRHALTDARIAFAVATALAAGLAMSLARLDGARRLRVVQALAVVPPAGLTYATGGDDLPVIATGLLALALVGRRRFGWAGVAAGLALATKLTALPLVVVAGVVAWSVRGRRGVGSYALGALGLPLLTLVPIVAADPAAAWENLIRYPFGMTERRSPAASPLPGRLLADHVPGGTALALGLTLAVGLAFLAWLWRRPPATAHEAATVVAAAMAAVVLVAPAARFGYLLYPFCLGAWSWATAPARGRLPGDGPDGGGDPDVLRGDGRGGARPAPAGRPAGTHGRRLRVA